MGNATPALLIGAVAAVGVLHTLVPDHWAPITLMARQRGWSRAQTARAAAVAGLGHTISTLVIAIVVWTAGVVFAARFGRIVDVVTSIALVGFGGWVAVGAWRELREGDAAACREPGDHAHHHHEPLRSHSHAHRHEELVHVHWHAHAAADWHDADGGVAVSPPAHEHEHSTSSRMAMLLILGSSPMIEGIPAFFAASRFGIGFIAVMSAVFAASTIATYVCLCVASLRGLERLSFGPLERYGEVLSGALIMVLGVVFFFVR